MMVSQSQVGTYLEHGFQQAGLRPVISVASATAVRRAGRMQLRLAHAKLALVASLAACLLLPGHGAHAADACPPRAPRAAASKSTSTAASNDEFWQTQQLPRDVRGTVIAHQQEDCLPPSVVRRTLSKEELQELRRVVREQSKKQAVRGAALRKMEAGMP